MDNLIVRTSFDMLVPNAQHQTIVCTDPCHSHNSPIQDMYTGPLNGHKVSLTVDGDFFSVRIDDNGLTDRHNLSFNEMDAYIKTKTAKKGNYYHE
jgi:hypothetical protein